MSELVVVDAVGVDDLVGKIFVVDAVDAEELGDPQLDSWLGVVDNILLSLYLHQFSDLLETI